MLRSIMFTMLVLLVAVTEGEAFAKGAVKGQHMQEGTIAVRRDASTGQATGKRMHKPSVRDITIKKSTDKASP